MIGLVGRRPSSPTALAAKAKLATTSANDLKALSEKSTKLGGSFFTEKDFPDHWGLLKHHFLWAQNKGKCAYCETRISTGYPGDVEHFRPKAYCQPIGLPSSLNDLGGKSPGRKTGPKTQGYWWLAYEWTNYVYSCNRCNSIWKKNQFPITGPRATCKKNISTEKALLINPFETDPATHFDFDPNTGQIRGLTPEGIATIEVCGLNRHTLDVDRQLKGTRLKKRLKAYAKGVSKGDIEYQNQALDGLLEECRSKEPYAAMARVFVAKKLGIDYPTLMLMKRKRIF